MKHKIQNTKKTFLERVLHVSCFMFHEEGSAIYLALFTLSAVLATALSVSTIAVGEYKISKEVVNSIQAIYVADSVIEYTMMEVRNNQSLSDLTANSTTTLSHDSCKANFVGSALNTNNIKCSASIDNDLSPLAGYSNCRQSIAALGADCTRIEARGSFGNINRAMEIVFENL